VVEDEMMVTREMISAAHKVTIERGDVVLSADLLTKLYEAMHAARRSRITWACPVCAASVQFSADAQTEKQDGT
jgi:hypothetical protein